MKVFSCLVLLPPVSTAQNVTKAQKEIVIEEWLTIEDAHDDETQAIEFTAEASTLSVVARLRPSKCGQCRRENW